MPGTHHQYLSCKNTLEAVPGRPVGIEEFYDPFEEKMPTDEHAQSGLAS
jgi:hypothetical protein